LAATSKGKGAETRERLIEASTDLFSEKGFDQTSVAEIAKRCGITHAAALYHFKTKLGLLEAVVNAGLARLDTLYDDIVENTDGAWERLRKRFQSHLTWMFIYKAQAEVLLLVSYFASVRPGFADLYSGVVTKGRSDIEELLLAGQREGIFHFDADPTLLAKALHDAVVGMMMNGLGGRRLVETMPGYVARVDLLVASMTGYSST